MMIDKALILSKVGRLYSSTNILCFPPRITFELKQAEHLCIRACVGGEGQLVLRWGCWMDWIGSKLVGRKVVDR